MWLNNWSPDKANIHGRGEKQRQKEERSWYGNTLQFYRSHLRSQLLHLQINLILILWRNCSTTFFYPSKNPWYECALWTRTTRHESPSEFNVTRPTISHPFTSQCVIVTSATEPSQTHHPSPVCETTPKTALPASCVVQDMSLGLLLPGAISLRVCAKKERKGKASWQSSCVRWWWTPTQPAASYIIQYSEVEKRTKWVIINSRLGPPEEKR